MFRALLVAALATMAVSGSAKEQSEASSPSPGVGGDVRLDNPPGDPHGTAANALAQTDARRRAQAMRMRQQLRDLRIDGSVAVGIAGGYKINTLQADEAAEAVRSGRVEGGADVLIERSAPVQITPL